MTDQDTSLQEPMSKEDKFFGQTTVVETSEEENTDVEITEGELKAKAEPKPDDELEEHSKKVQKRIDKLTYEAREAQRQQKTAEGIRDEAIRAAQSLHGRNQEYERIITTGEAQLVDRIKTGAETAVNFAKANYAKAVDADDTEAVVEAQNNLVQAQAEMIEANRYDADYKNRVAQYAAQQQWAAQQQRPAPPQVQEPDPEVKEWAKENPWFHDPAHFDMTSLAYGVHEDLIRNKGVQVNSDEYYQEIDTVMRQRFPEYFDKPKPATVVAPAQRNNAATPRKVTITASAAAVAKQLGLTNEQYAQQVLKDRGMTNV